jgi:Ca2+-binding RTX toxin-like protein
MPLNLIFTQPGNFTIDDNGIPGDNTSVIRDGTGTVIHTFVHPVDSLAFTVSTPGVNLTFNFTDSLGAANVTIGDLTSAAATPDSLTIGNLRTTGIVTLVSNGAITELGADAGVDILASQIILSAATGVGTTGNAIETQTFWIEAETVTGGINISNFGSVQIGGISNDVSGLHVQTSGDINFTTVGSIFLSDATGSESVRGGNTSGNVTLTAIGIDSNIIANVDSDAIAAPGGNIVLEAGRDIAFGTVGADFDNDVRARGSITIEAGRDFLVDGFSDIASDDFGAATGGNVEITAGRNIHVRNIAGVDGSILANGSAGADVILTTGAGGALILDAPSAFAVSSISGDVVANVDSALISVASGITASSGQIILRPATAGREIDLGSASDAAFALELSAAELDRFFATTLTIGGDNTGQITVSSAIAPASTPDLILRSGGDIAVQAAITTNGDLELRAGDNLVLTGAPALTVADTLSIFVDTLGNDGGAGGIVDLSTATIIAAEILVNGAGDNDTLTGAQGLDQIFHGNGGNDTITSSGEGHYFGDAGDDLIIAGLSTGLVPEVLDGGADVDTLDTRLYIGGYIIDLATGVTNFAYESFINFENVIVGHGVNTVTGTGAANHMTGGTNADTFGGGGGDDTLLGSDGNDVLDGGSGADTMEGGADNDSYIVDNAGDQTVEAIAGGTDTVRSWISWALADNIERLQLLGGANNSATGNALENELFGNAGNNALNGSVGADRMEGFGGNDSYIVDDAGDQTVEAIGGGTDTVRSWINWTLDDNVERLQLLGGANNSATGNTLGNELFGNTGNNVLNGRAGADRMEGFGGNDSYFVDNAGDDVIEAVGGGTDTVRAWTTWTLGANLERLVLLGTTEALNGAGNSLNNEIFGNAGDNRLAGWAGNDTLTGGAGLDTFIFNTALNAATNVDTITDFSVADDTIRLDDAIFTAIGPLGTLAAAAFTIGAAATTAAHRIVYNSATGALIYDSNGSAAGGATQFAILDTGLALTNADFLIA